MEAHPRDEKWFLGLSFNADAECGEAQSRGNSKGSAILF